MSDPRDEAGVVCDVPDSAYDEHALAQLHTLAAVQEYCVRRVRDRYGKSSADRTALAGFTVGSVVKACLRYARMRIDRLHQRERLSCLASDAHVLLSFCGLCYSDGPLALERAHVLLGSVQLDDMVEALAASIPGTAWAQLAEHEVARRRGEIAAWRWDSASGRVERT